VHHYCRHGILSEVSRKFTEVQIIMWI